MKLVEIESPFSGDTKKNIVYARRCVLDSLRRGEAPLASHLLYTQEGILDDNVPLERKLGIKVGKAWSAHAELVAAYIDLGISDGMSYGISVAQSNGIEIEYRKILDPGESIVIQPEGGIFCGTCGQRKAVMMVNKLSQGQFAICGDCNDKRKAGE